MAEIGGSASRNASTWATVHDGTVYLTGQVGTPLTPPGAQMREVLDKVDALLAEAGTDKSRLLHCTLWLDDHARCRRGQRGLGRLGRQGEHAGPLHGQSRMARPGVLVELTVIAAL
jgi:enamine deaminase RidA (YjgF/YER057c/UK114 family)